VARLSAIGVAGSAPGNSCAKHSRSTLVSLHDALLKEAETAVITFVEPGKRADTRSGSRSIGSSSSFTRPAAGT
jgi:hypothetical protein